MSIGIMVVTARLGAKRKCFTVKALILKMVPKWCNGNYRFGFATFVPGLVKARLRSRLFEVGYFFLQPVNHLLE